MILAQLIWTDKRGGWHIEQGQAARLAKKLETLRRPADLWLLDEYGVKVETVGGCEEASGQDDKRIKWNWWYDKSAVGAVMPDEIIEE
jgi:hypothetical protein